MDRIIIAIDGTAASGKTTIGTELGKNLAIPFFDSGLIYRVITALVLEHYAPQNTDESAALLQHKKNIQFISHLVPRIQDDNGRTIIIVEGKDYTPILHTKEVDTYVPTVSASREIREYATLMLQELGMENSIVMAGRDIGTIVYPQAIHIDNSEKSVDAILTDMLAAIQKEALRKR